MSGAIGGAVTYVLFPQIRTQTQTVEKPVYVYVNNTVYQNRTMIEYRNNTVYVQVQPNCLGQDSYFQGNNISYVYTHVQNLSYLLITNWSAPRVTKLTGYFYSFSYNGTHVFSNFTVDGPPNTLFGVGISMVSNEGIWFWLGEDYTNQAGSWTILLRTISVNQPDRVSIGVLVNYNA